uniref:Uncharacterized protein n=1 Tax=Anguilla anguilla TaxID=7936 RepID=A0A0E9V1L0_ANGAN
MAEERRAFN